MRFALRNLVIAVLLSVASSAQFIDINTQTKGSRLPSWGVDSGSANAYAITTIQAIGSGGVLQTGSSFAFIATNANTGASTLAVDGGSAIAITKFGATALASGDIPSSVAVTVIYDGTNFQMQGVLPTSGGIGSGAGCSTGLPGSVCAYYPNSSNGTTLNHVVRFDAATINQTNISDFTNADFPGWASGMIGIVQSGAGTSGLAEVCTAGRCLCDFDNAATKGDFVDIAINTSNAPKCHDSAAGLNEDPQAHTFFGKVRTTIGSAGVTDVDMLTVMAFENGAYSGFGAGNVAIIGAGGQHLNISPMGLETATGNATTLNPYMGLFTGFRIRSQSNFGEFFDLYGTASNGGTDTSELVISDGSGNTATGAAIRMQCIVGSCGGTQAIAHYTPSFTFTLSGTTVFADTQADVWDITLSGNLAVTFQRPRPGHVGWWHICQDATGGRTFSVKGNGGSTVFDQSVTIATAANACTSFTTITINNNYTNPLLAVVGTAGTGGGGGSPTGIAGGDLSGTYPNPTVAQVNGAAVPTSAAVAGTNSSQQIIAATAHGIAGPLTCADASGSGTTQTCTTSPSFTPAAKDCVWYTPGTSNSGALTLNVNSAGAKAVQKWLGTALASGDAPSGKTQLACYDGTNWQVMTIGNAPSAGAISGATNNGAMYATGATTGTSTGAMTDGQVLIGDTAGVPQASTIAGGAGITVTPGHHSISVALTGGATGTGGPALAGIYCGATGSFSCASVINVVSHQLIVMTCGYFTNGAGAGTPAASDTLSLTWHLIATTFNGTQSRGAAAFWADPGTTGADTFTCSNSVGISFGGMAVHLLSGATLASPVDVSGTDNGNNAQSNIALATTSANDAMFSVTEFGSGAAFQGIFYTIINDNSQAIISVYTPAGAAGTYYSQIHPNGSYAHVAFAIH